MKTMFVVLVLLVILAAVAGLVEPNPYQWTAPAEPNPFNWV